MFGCADVFRRPISEPLLSQQFDLALPFHMPDGACNCREGLVVVEWLRNKVVGSKLHRLHRIRPRTVGGEKDDRHGRK